MLLKIRKFIKKFHLQSVLGLYLVLILININEIPIFAGEERQYWESVQYLMDGEIDTNNHPLLAKTVWFFTVNLFYIFTGTDVPFFWRAGTIVFSLLSLLLFYKITRLKFSPLLSLCGAIFLAFDPMYFVFSRLMQLDIIALFFSLGTFYYIHEFLKKGQKKLLLYSSLLLGLSLSVKLSSLSLLPVLAIYLIYKTKNIKLILSFIFTTVLAFTLGNLIFVYTEGLLLYPTYLKSLIEEQFTFAVSFKNTQYSPAWSWFTLPQILTMFRFDLGDKVSAILAFQNPMLFVVSALSVLVNLILLLKKKIKDEITILSLIFIGALYIPWLFNLRTVYYYYIIPLLPFLILLILNLFIYFRLSLKYIFTGITLSLIIFSLYYPLLIGLEIPKKYEMALYTYSQYNFGMVNNLFCQNCSPRK